MDLFHVGFLVNAKFSALFPSEVFHAVGNIDFSPVDIRLFETLIK